MFGSISNWITTTSTNLTSNIPPVNIPNIPELFSKTITKSDQEVQPSDLKNTENENPNANVDKLEHSVSMPPTDSLILDDSQKLANQIEENKNANNIVDNEEKVGVINQLDIDAQKAYGQAKEIGSNEMPNKVHYFHSSNSKLY